MFAQEDVAWTPWLRTVVGVRLDYVGFAVTDHLDELAPDGATGSGVRERARVRTAHASETDDAGGFVGCEDVHFTPGAPVNVMLTARAFF